MIPASIAIKSQIEDPVLVINQSILDVAMLYCDCCDLRLLIFFFGTFFKKLRSKLQFFKALFFFDEKV